MHWKLACRRGSSTCQSYDLGLAANLTGSCLPGVTEFLVEVINLKSCSGTGQARGCRGLREAAAQGRCKSYDLILAVTGCKPDLELLSRFYCFGAAAVLRCTLLADCGQQLAYEAGPCKGHSNNLKCWTSGLKVFPCYEDAMMY